MMMMMVMMVIARLSPMMGKIENLSRSSHKMIHVKVNGHLVLLSDKNRINVRATFGATALLLRGDVILPVAENGEIDCDLVPDEDLTLKGLDTVLDASLAKRVAALETALSAINSGSSVKPRATTAPTGKCT
jgi:hypothetical protein